MSDELMVLNTNTSEEEIQRVLAMLPSDGTGLRVLVSEFVDNVKDAMKLVDQLEAAEARLAALEAGSEPIGRVDIAGGLFIEPHEYDLYRIDDMTPVYTTPQPAPAAVPDVCTDSNHHERYVAGWNACRAEMLKLSATPKPAAESASQKEGKPS